MQKGWDSEYIIYQKELLSKKLQEETNKKIKNDIQEQIDLYDELLLKLLITEGEIQYEKVSLKDFHEMFYGSSFVYKYNKDIVNKLNEYAMFLLTMPRIHVPKFKDNITETEALDVVGDFILDKFGDEYYKLYVENIRQGKSYVLFDKTIESSKITTIKNENFVELRKSDDIVMSSQLAHEMGHLNRIILSKRPVLENYLKEFESFFYEVSFLFWLIDNHIYEDDAFAYVLKLFSIFENTLISRMIISNNNLNKIKDYNEFKEKLKTLHVRSLTLSKTNDDLYSSLVSAIEMDIRKYLYSFMAVLNNIDNYNSVYLYTEFIKNIKNHNEDYLKRSFLNQEDDFIGYMLCRELFRKKIN